MSLFPCSLPVLGFAAFSGTGKTTLLEMLIPSLIQQGVRVAMIKHAHHDFDVDKPGKDSFRLRKAGATQMLISSRYRNALMTETLDKGACLDALLARIDPDKADLILVEGFKDEPIPKIELNRKELGKPWLHENDPHILAIACDSAPNTSLPLLDINDISAITAFIFEWIEREKYPNKKSATCDAFSSNMLSVKQAQENIQHTIKTKQKTSMISLDDLYNRVLGEPVIAPVNVPSTTNSAMDGYAIRSQDISLEGEEEAFFLAGEVFAGHQYDKPLEKGQCVRIMTGAPIPEKADTVIMKEQAKAKNDLVYFDLKKGTFSPGQNVRQAGEDIQKSHVVFEKGTRVSSPVLGMIASLGFERVPVFSPLKVALFSTGDEVQAPGSALKDNCIFDSNSYTLRSMLKKLGCKVIDFGIVKDSQKALEDVLIQATAQADMVICSGGVSVGDADHIKTVLNARGEMHFWRVNMRPGRPLAFGTLFKDNANTPLTNCPFFGLPGNPVAVMVTFLAFVEPAIRQMQGETSWAPLRFKAIAKETIRSRKGRTEYTRGIYNMDETGQLSVRSTGTQGSGILSSMAKANCLIEISPDIENAEKGSLVSVIPLTSRL